MKILAFCAVTLVLAGCDSAFELGVGNTESDEIGTWVFVPSSLNTVPNGFLLNTKTGYLQYCSALRPAVGEPFQGCEVMPTTIDRSDFTL